MRLSPRHVLCLLLLVFAAGLQADVPALELKDLEGKLHSLDDYPGKMVVVNYWATWCPPCLEEIPELAIFHEQHKDTAAVVLGVAYDEVEPQRLRQFAEEQMIDYPILPVEPGSVTPFGALMGLPMTYVIAADRSVVRPHLGLINAEMLQRYLDRYGPAAGAVKDAALR